MFVDSGDLVMGLKLYQAMTQQQLYYTPVQLVGKTLLEATLAREYGLYELAEYQLIEALDHTKHYRHSVIYLSILTGLYELYEEIGETALSDSIEVEMKTVIEAYEVVQHQMMYQVLDTMMDGDSFLMTSTIRQLRSNHQLFEVLAGGLILTLVTSLGFYVMKYFVKKRHMRVLDYQIQLLNESLDVQQEHYEEQMIQQRYVRELHHDLKHHQHILSLLLQQEDYEQATVYVQQFGEHLKTVDTSVESHHLILNALLKSKRHTCEQKGVELEAKVCIPATIQVSDLTLITIFSNLFDNAIEACEKITSNQLKKKINVTAYQKGSFVFIKMENTKQHKIIEKRQRLVTTKADKKRHGIGISSIERVIEPHEGTLKYDYTDTSFTVNILLSETCR